jgi:hypothetical protein
MSATTTHWDVYWRGRLVGTVLWPAVDNFDINGRWRPRPGEPLDSFLQAVEDDEEALVSVGRPRRGFYGFVKAVPDGEINIKYSVTLNAG